MLTLKVDPSISRKADDEDLLTQVFSRDPERLAYIVRAVNAHEALVEMVKELRQLVRVTGPLTTARERADKLLASLE